MRPAVILLACLLVAGAAQPARAQPPPGEYEVKAAFVVRFAEFVRWPAEAFADERSPLVLCVAGDDPFGPAFDPFARGMVAGRPLAVRPVDPTAPLPKSCHLLFVARSEAPRLTGIGGALAGAPVLTVSDLEGFAADGGMIQFFLRDGKVRFEINRQAAESAGLKIDARLLKLSTPAHGVAAGGPR